mgnify:CR=1 FL=1
MSYIGNTLPANFQSLPAVQRFNGDGSDTTFTLAAQIANDQSILVSVDGVTQDSNAYSVSGTTLTFTAAPSAGTGNIFVNTISPVGSTLVPPDGIAINASTGTFSGAVSATTGTFSGAVSGTTGTFSGALSGTTGTFSGGKIGNNSGFFIGGAGAGLRLQTNDIIPTEESGNLRDGTKSLGISSARFKELYLSGGVFLGGTGSANELDDYEIGTYTATISCASGSITLNSSFNELAYTKVGRVVHVQGFLKVSSVSSPTGATNLNLPFTSVQTTDHSGRADNLGYAFLNGSAVTNGNYILFNELLHNQANNRIFWDNNNSANNIGDNVTAADTDLRMNFSYIAA